MQGAPGMRRARAATMLLRAPSLLLAVLPLACAAPPNPGLRAEFPGRVTPAEDIDWADLSFTGSGGLPMYGQRWRAKAGEPKAVVVIHHGLADHSTRFSDFAQQLVRAGYTVWAHDMRGHGRSAGPRVSFPSIDTLVADFDAFLTVVRTQEPGRKIFVYGHSVGGHVTTRYTIDRQPDFAGIVLSSPALQLETAPFQASSLHVLSRLTPNLPAFDLPHAYFSQRAEVVTEMDTDPLISQVKGPVHTPRALFASAERIWANADKIRVPLFAQHGSVDEATPPTGSRDLVARASSTDKTLVIYDGLKHDMLREPNGAGERVTADVIAWLDARASGTGSVLPSTPWRVLKGDRPQRALSLELDGRGEAMREGDKTYGVTLGARVRYGAGRATGIGIGYFGGVDLRGGMFDDGYYEADAHLVGLALRSRGGALFAITGGAGIGGFRGATATRAPVEVSLELPAGGARVLARAGAAWRLGGDEYADDAFGIADEAMAMLGVRLGRDHRYWGSFVAGGGPFLGVTYRNLGGGELFGLTLGLDLWEGY